jgi:meso-butanediol dehydrogenase / (S,S)-butanediol dehydrogenase / diacetyl reductase
VSGARQVAVVTGAGSGIGAAIARELSDRGFAVLVTDLDPVAAGAVAAECEGAVARAVDVTDRASVEAAAAAAVAELGGLDVWCSNAGISHMARFTEVTEQQLDLSLSVNLKGVFVCGQVAASTMRERGGGVIVNTASMAGKQGRVPYLADYVASKFGVVGLTQAMALELAPDGIRVNSVCPGYVATPMQDRELAWEAELRGTDPDAVKQLWLDDTPMGRLERPEDVARVVAFLVGEDAAFVTGEAVAVNGGAFMD